MLAPSNLTALELLLSKVLQDYLERSNSSSPAPLRSSSTTSLEIIYVLLMVGLFGFFTVGVMVTNLRSRGSPEPLEPLPGSGRNSSELCRVLQNRLALERPLGQIPQEKSP